MNTSLTTKKNTPDSIAKAALDLKSLARHMGEVESFCQQKLKTQKDERFRAQIQNTQLGLYRLVVMGEIKKGKSSFINALCGIENMVPELSDVATSTIFKIRHEERLAYDVFFKENKTEPKGRKLSIRPEQLPEYGTEAGNPGNHKEVDFIAVQAPSPLLSGGLIIVDTPGVGGLFKNHREITWKYAPNADAIFFVTDSLESPIGAEEVIFLKELRKITGLIYFVQTKSDKVDRNAAQKRMENNLQILESQVGIPRQDLVYFMVSSKLKKLADKSKDLDDLQASGFLPLMSFLNINLKGAKDRNLASVSISRTSHKLGEAGFDLAKRMQVLEADTKEKQDALQEEARKVEIAMQEWRTNKAPEMEKKVRRSIQDTFSDTMKDLNQQLRPGGRISEEIRARLVKIDSASEIYRVSGSIAADINATASELVHNGSKLLQKNVQSVINESAAQVGAQLEQALSSFDQTEVVWSGQVALQQIVAKANQTDGFVKARSAFYGGAFGAAIAGTVGGVVGSVIPVIGTIIGSHIGLVVAALIGGKLSVDNQNQQEAERARMEVQGLLDREMANMLASIQADLNKIQSQLTDCALDSLKTIFTQTQQHLTAQKTQVEQRRKMDGQALAVMTEELTGFRKSFELLSEQQSIWETRLAGV